MLKFQDSLKKFILSKEKNISVGASKENRKPVLEASISNFQTELFPCKKILLIQLH